MTLQAISEVKMTNNDLRLINEAINRLSNIKGGETLNRDAMTTVLSEELRRGRRDMFSLVRVGRRALDDL